MKTKRILASLVVTLAVAGAVVAGSAAFFSDTETSEDNVLQAGAIDLMIDNHSWYFGENGWEWVEELSWSLEDPTGLFFYFEDLKPGDQGEDTVSIHIFDNPAWLCAGIKVDMNDDITCTEPEEGDDPECVEPDADLMDGELAEELSFAFWMDDGDNVWECSEESLPGYVQVEGVPGYCERPLLHGPAEEAIGGLTFALADSSDSSVWGGEPIEPSTTHYIGKYWCYGEFAPAPAMQDGYGAGYPNGPDQRGPGFSCDGEPTDNRSQTDRVEGDVVFYAVQSRHNESFLCSEWNPNGGPEEEMRTLSLENKDENWDVIPDDGTKGDIDYSHNGTTFHGVVTGQGLETDAKYQITLNGPGVCTTTDDNLAGFGGSLFESGYWNNWAPNLSSTCVGSPGEGIYNMNLIADWYTVMSDASGNLYYEFDLALPAGDYSGVKVLVKKMLDTHVSPWVDSSVEHATNLFETAPISFTVLP